MSYILDALKKSDTQAQTGKLPSIHSHAEPAQLIQRPAWQAMLVGGLITALLVIAAIQFFPSLQTETLETPVIPAIPKTVSDAVQTISATAPPPVRPASTPPAVKLPDPHVKSMPETQTIPSTAPVPAPVLSALSAPAPPKPVLSKPATLPEPNALEITATIASPQSTETSVRQIPVLRSELPVTIQQSLPPIQISGHIFDKNPAARMVFINGHIYHQGDNISPQLKLVAITPSGVEMNFRGSSFRVDIIRQNHSFGKINTL